MDFILISRKDCRRPGRRFITRGVNNDGHAANFVETESIFVYREKGNKINIGSLVQIRGSIPMIWTSAPNMKWTPRVKIHKDFNESKAAAINHFAEAKKYYGDHYLVNLIDKKGDQKKLGNEFAKLHESLDDKCIKYVWFDFHDECKKM